MWTRLPSATDHLRMKKFTLGRWWVDKVTGFSINTPDDGDDVFHQRRWPWSSGQVVSRWIVNNKVKNGLFRKANSRFFNTATMFLTIFSENIPEIIQESMIIWMIISIMSNSPHFAHLPRARMMLSTRYQTDYWGARAVCGEGGLATRIRVLVPSIFRCSIVYCCVWAFTFLNGR